MNGTEAAVLVLQDQALRWLAMFWTIGVVGGRSR
jgi:hypothetical protein